MRPPPAPNRSPHHGVGAASLALAQVCVGSAMAHGHTLKAIDQVRPIPDAISNLPGETPYARGKRLLAAGDVAASLTVFRQALIDAPESADILDGVAVCYDRMGRPELARPYYDAALRLEPGAGRLHNNLGYSLLLAARPDEAVAELKIAAASDDARAAAAARATLAALNAKTLEPPSPPPVARAFVEEPPRAEIERTSEGEQRLVLAEIRDSGRDGPQAALVAPTPPWRLRDDARLIAAAGTPTAVSSPSQPLVHRQSSGEGRGLVAVLGMVAPIVLRSPAAVDPEPSKELVAPENIALTIPPLAEGRYRKPETAISDAGGRGPRLSGDRPPERPFKSDDERLNAFAARMRALRLKGASRWV